jgi:O-antigen ligase
MVKQIQIPKNFFNNILNIQKILFLFLPFTLFARFFSDLFLVLICLIFLIQTIKFNLYKYYKNIFFKFFLLFWLYISLRSFFTLNIDSIISSLGYIRFGIFPLAVWYLLDSDKNLLVKFFKFLFFTFVIYIFDGYFQSIFGIDIFLKKNVDPERITAFFGNEQILGSFLSRLFPLLVGLYFLIKKNNLNNNIVIIPFIISLSFLMFLTGERTAIFFFVFFSLIIIIFTKPFLIKKIVIFFLCVIFFLVASNISIYKKTIDSRIYWQTKQNIIKGDRLRFATDVHEFHIITAYKIFIDNTLFGVGNKMFRIVCQEQPYIIYKGCTTHPHNIFFQFLAELGIFGTLFYLLALYYLLKNFITNFYNKKKKFFLQNYKTCLLFGFIISLFPLAPSGNFFNNWLSIIFYLPVGFYLHHFYDKKL